MGFSTLLVFSISLVIRPLGGALFGRIADKYGGRFVLYTTMIGAGLSTFLMGFLPTYEQAGVLGPAGLVILRIAIGLFLGGETRHLES